MPVKINFEYVKNFINGENGNACFLLSKEYINCLTNLKVVCKCSNEFYVTWDAFRNGKRRCKTCSNKIRNKKTTDITRFSFEKIEKRYRDLGFIVLDSQYKNANNKINIESILTGYRYCVVYSQIKQAKYGEKSLQRFSQSSPYTKYNILLWIKKEKKQFILNKIFIKTGLLYMNLSCIKCKNQWSSLLFNVTSAGQGCPYCGHKKTTKENNLAITFPDICKEWDYDKNAFSPENYLPHSNKKVYWICSECGYKWKTMINLRTSKQKNCCPRCSKSKGEKRVEYFLLDNKIIFTKQFSFSDCRHKRLLEFDFAVFSNLLKTNLICLIEYDGELHYRPYRKIEDAIEYFDNGKKRDKIKNEYCNKNNLLLIRIPYWEYDNIEKILTKELKL